MLKERTLTPAEDAKKEDLVHHMKKKLQGFKERYGKDAKSVMYATATSRAKELAEGVNTSHAEYIKKHKPSKPCSAHDMTFGGKCFNCGYSPTIKEATHLTELSRSTLKSYIKKASPELAHHAGMSGYYTGKPMYTSSQLRDNTVKAMKGHSRKEVTRQSGVVRAAGKLEEAYLRKSDEHMKFAPPVRGPENEFPHGTTDLAKFEHHRDAYHTLAQSANKSDATAEARRWHAKQMNLHSSAVIKNPRQGAKLEEAAAPFMTTYKRNESANRHTANIVHLAKHFGDEADQAKAKFYADELKKHGHNMHHEAQYELHKKLWPKAEKAHTYKESTGDTMEKSQLLNEEVHAYDVHHKGKHIDTIFYGHHEDPAEVKRSLVNHDNYHPDITVKKQPKKKLHEGEVSKTFKTVKQVLAEMSTRKHFQQVADLIKGHPDPKKRQELANRHAEFFAKENPNFSHELFHKAAGTKYTKA